MKGLFTILNLLLVLFVCNAQSLNWTTVQNVNNGQSYGRPRITLTQNNAPLVIWKTTATNASIKAAKWNGTTFSAPYDVVSSALVPTGFIGPEIASKGDTIYLIFLSGLSQNNAVMLISSFDGGLSFSDTLRVSDNSNTHKYSMPNVAVNHDGNPIISYMECTDSWTEYKQMVKISSDFGNTFSAAIDVSALAPGEPCDCCKSSLVANGNEVFLLFRNNDNNVRNAYIAKSSDGGNTFNAVSDIDNVNWVINACPSTSPQGMISGDSVVVVRRSGANGQNRMLLSNVNATDLQYSYNHNIDPISFGLQDYPEIDGNKDTIGIVWQDNRNSYMDCFFSFSTNGTAAISGSTILNDTNITGSKLNPDIAYANKTFHFVYLGSNTHTIYYRTATFAANTAIQDKKDISYRIFPNPASDQISINSNLSGRIIIMDMYGNVLVSEKKSSSQPLVLDLSNLPSGVLIVDFKGKKKYLLKL